MVEHIKKPRLLRALEVPNSKFELFSMDFIMSLLKTQIGYYSICVIMDQLTKIAHLIPTVTTMTAYGVTGLFTINVSKIHGMPS
jgi:hypothetical protein